MLYWLVRDARLVGVLGGGHRGDARSARTAPASCWCASRAACAARVGVAWRYGVANLARRGRESVVQVVAFGLGLMVLLLLAVVRGDLLKDWRASLPADTPNFFMINIPAAETGAFARFMEERGAAGAAAVPDDPRAHDGHQRRGRSRRSSPPTTAARVSPSASRTCPGPTQPQVDNRIVAGRWWDDADRGEP